MLVTFCCRDQDDLCLEIQPKDVILDKLVKALKIGRAERVDLVYGGCLVADQGATFSDCGIEVLCLTLSYPLLS